MKTLSRGWIAFAGVVVFALTSTLIGTELFLLAMQIVKPVEHKTVQEPTNDGPFVNPDYPSDKIYPPVAFGQVEKTESSHSGRIWIEVRRDKAGQLHSLRYGPTCGPQLDGTIINGVPLDDCWPPDGGGGGSAF